MGSRWGRLTPLLLLIMFGLAGVASAKRAAPKQPPKQPPKEEPKPKPEPAKPQSNSYWEPLVTKGNRWTLSPNPQTDPASRITIEVYDAREWKGVKVARLRWTVTQGTTTSPMGNSLPTQIAITKKGVYLLTDRLDDAAVVKAVKGKPTFADPPKPFTKDDSYVRKDGDKVCIGVGTPPDKKCEAGTCHAEYCLQKGGGVISIGGNFTPNAGDYTGKPPVNMEASLRTGIPECDEFMTRWYQCAQNMDPGLRDSMIEQIKEIANNFKAAAATPEGRQMLQEQCIQILPQIDQILEGMGCRP